MSAPLLFGVSQVIYKRCPKCHKRIPSGTECPKCKDINDRKWKKPEGIAKLYHTNRWRKIRDVVMAKYDWMDAFALSHGRVVPADTVHHIIPAKEDPDKFWDPSNLIPVSRESHQHIHGCYDESDGAKKDMIITLQRLVRKFNT